MSCVYTSCHYEQEPFVGVTCRLLYFILPYDWQHETDLFGCCVLMFDVKRKCTAFMGLMCPRKMRTTYNIHLANIRTDANERQWPTFRTKLCATTPLFFVVVVVCYVCVCGCGLVPVSFMLCFHIHISIEATYTHRTYNI